MNWKKVLYSLIIGAGITMTMAACSENENDNLPITNPDDLLEDGYLSFQSTLESAKGTRAPGSDEGTANEQRVNRVRIVLYDAATNIANYAFDYSGTSLHTVDQDFKGTSMLDPTSGDAPTGYNPTYKGFMPQAMKVKVKPYKLLVLVNPSEALVDLTKAAKEYKNIKPSATNFVEATTNLSNCTVFRDKTGTANNNDLSAFLGGKANYSDSPNDFLMSNFQEYVNVAVTLLQKTEKAAYEAPVAVKVDRAVAKVSMKADYTAISKESAGTVSDGTWRLDVTNKTGYFMRHIAKALGNATEGAATLRENFYAEDPNFNKYSWARYTFNNLPVPSDLKTTSKADIKNYFNYITNADVTITLDNDWSYEYALENTMEADEQYEDVTTAAILKVKYLPKKTAFDADLNKAGYFVWKGYVFTAAELVEVRDYVTSKNDPKFETFLTLKEYLLKDKTNLEDAAGFGSNYTTPGSVSKQVGELAYNADGINYYRILIRHFGDDQEPNKMAYGRYGIVRNNWYRLTLNKIAGPGSIDIPDPEGPDDKDQFLGVSIEVLPWLTRDQGVVID